LSIEIDAMVNSLVAYFKKFGKKKCDLNGIQKELNDLQNDYEKTS